MTFYNDDFLSSYYTDPTEGSTAANEYTYYSLMMISPLLKSFILKELNITATIETLSKPTKQLDSSAHVSVHYVKNVKPIYNHFNIFKYCISVCLFVSWS